MSTKEKQSFALYFLLAFGLAWLCQVYGSLLLLRDGNATVYRALLSVSMFCPLVAVLAAKRIVLHQPTGIGWKVRGKRRYWLAAWFGPAVFTVLAALLYFAVFSSRLDLSGSWLVTAYGGEMDAETLRSQLGISSLSYMLETGLFAITLAPPINMLFAVGEEAGWRGYMMPQLKERFGLLAVCWAASSGACGIGPSCCSPAMNMAPIIWAPRCWALWCGALSALH